MTEHQQFRQLLDKLDLDYRGLAEILGMSYKSVNNQLSPSKKLPRWAKAMLYVSQNK